MSIHLLFSLISRHIETILLITFFIVSFIQIFYYVFFYSRIFTLKPQTEAKPIFNKPVSVIIAAHNEAHNLRQFLPLVLEQDYPEFEVIVINDRSEDETDTVILEFKKKYKHLKSTFINNNGKLTHGKKLAITLGVKASAYDYVVLTDADCKPISNQWIKEMVQGFSSTDIVLGYGPYFEEKSFLNKMIRFDTLFIALQYMTFAKAGVPYMGIGRNLAYKKDLFIQNKGLVSHAHIRSGDDDLFINEVANSKNTSLSIAPDSFVYSNPKTTFKEWIWQKQRHLTTFKRYKKYHRVLLATEVYSRMLFYILLIILSPIFINNYFFIAVAVIRFLLLMVMITYSSQFFNEKRISLFAIFFDFTLPVLNFFVYLVYPKLKD